MQARRYTRGRRCSFFSLLGAQMNKSGLSAFPLCGAVLLFAFFLVFAPLLHGQFGSSITGTVLDPTGAVIPNAKITLTNEATQSTQTTTSSPQGFYRFGSLGPGSYTVKAELQGFQAQTLNKIGVGAEANRSLDIHLNPEGSSQSVTVNANDVPLLQTSDASIGSSVDSKQITRMPIFGRDPYELVRTAVGTTADGARSGTGGGVYLPNASGPGQSNYGIFQTENQIQVSAAGQRVTSNSYLIDGVSVDSLQHGGSAIITPNPEAVAEITTTTTSYDASDGRNVGAQIKTVTKSGTNDIHGSLFFQYDEPGLNAYQRYGGPAGVRPQRVQNKQREWAASIGGPIIKNKLFLFASYEGVKNTNTSYSQQYILAAPFRNYLKTNRSSGIVNKILNAANAQPRIAQILPARTANFDLCTNILNTGQNQTQCRYVGSGVNVGAFSGATGTYTNQMGGATSAATLDNIENIDYALVATPMRFRANQFNGRVDWNVTPHDLFAASVFFTKLAQVSGDAGTGAQPISDVAFKPLSQSGTLVYIHTFSSSMTNEARANYTRFSDNQIEDTRGMVDWSIPRLEVQGYSFGRLSSGIPTAQSTPGIFAQNTYEVRDTFTWVFGAHTLKLGGQFRWEQDNDNLNGFARPIYVFQGIYNLANDAPIFESVAANPNSGGVPNAQRYFRDHDYAGFAQHDWKIRPNLTLNTGLRYEYFSPLRNKGASIYTPQLSSTAGSELVNATLQPVENLWGSNNNNWAPKLGLAWTPARLNDKMVVRAGFGALYDRLDDILYINNFQNGPGYFLYNLCCATSDASAQSNGILFGVGSSNSPFSYTNSPLLKTGINPATNTPNGFAAGTAPTIEVWGGFKRTKQPVVYAFSLETQYQLPYQMALTVGYQGSVGRHFPRIVNQNFLYQTCTPKSGSSCSGTDPHTPFSSTYIPTTDVTSNYNAVNTQLTKRYHRGFQLNFIYTYAKSMDQLSNEGPSALSNQTNPAHPVTEYGPSDFDVRHRVTLSGLWELPKYRNGRGLLGQVLSGWQMNGIYTWHTGFPWTPVTGKPSVQYIQSAATISPTRPIGYYGGAGNDCSNSAYKTGSNFSGGGAKYFNTSTSGAPGIGRNSWNGPCYMSTDMSFAKQQAFSVVSHEMQLRFQANFYNTFNQTNLSPITLGSNAATIENTLFGLSPSADAGRVIEFLVRLQF